MSTEKSDRVQESARNAQSNSNLYLGLDMTQFQSQMPRSNAQSFLPKFEEALAERCQELGTDAGACVKALKRHGLS